MFLITKDTISPFPVCWTSFSNMCLFVAGSQFWSLVPRTAMLYTRPNIQRLC